jgi:hypothetical protein
VKVKRKTLVAPLAVETLSPRPGDLTPERHDAWYRRIEGFARERGLAFSSNDINGLISDANARGKPLEAIMTKLEAKCPLNESVIIPQQRQALQSSASSPKVPASKALPMHNGRPERFGQREAAAQRSCASGRGRVGCIIAWGGPIEDVGRGV